MKTGIDPAIRRTKAKLVGIGATTLILLLAGCGGNTRLSNSGSTSGATPAALHGTVHGGQSGLVGSAVAVYAVDDPKPLVMATTAAGGGFTANFTCPSSTALIYVTVQGGSPGGANPSNSAVSLESAVAPCGSLPAFVDIDELSTVATAYALSAFHSSTGISSSGNTLGISNAFATVASLVNVVSGGPASTLPDAGACSAGSPPANCLTVQRLDALGNSAAACVNSAGPTSAQCTELFNCATPGASFSGGACTAGAIAPTDTLHALLNVAQNPGTVSIAGVYDVPTQDAVFSPTLGAAPTDWTLSIDYTDTSFDGPYSVAIDAAGDAWITNLTGDSVTELSPTGAVMSGSGYTGDMISPYGIAIDQKGDVWIANYYGGSTGYGSVTELDSSGVSQSGSGYGSGTLDNPYMLAVDQSGNIWVEDLASSNLTELQGSSAASPGALIGGSPYSGGGLDSPYGVAIDGSGNVWLPNDAYSGTVSEYLPGSPGAWANSSGFSCGLKNPVTIAIDQKGNVWVSSSYSYVSELASDGSCLSGGGYAGGGQNQPYGIAIDGAGNVWLSNFGDAIGTGISKLQGASGSSPGSALSPAAAGFTGAGLDTPIGVAIDSSGNLWTANYSNNSITEFIGVAAPVKTPLIGPPQSPN